MQQTPLQAEFEKISKGLREGEDFALLETGLASIRDAIRDLQENGGFRVSLEVRPVAYKSAAPGAAHAVANGTMTIDDVGVEFLIVNENHGRYKKFSAFVGESEVMSTFFDKDAKWLKDSVLNLMLKVKAENDIMSAYNVGRNGLSRLPAEKPAPPKLKLPS